MENVASEIAQRFIDHLNARDFAAARAYVADDFVRLDRRHGVSAPPADGPDAFIEAATAWYDVGFAELTLEPLAVRGDRCVMGRLCFRAADGREVVYLGVYETDAHGKIARGVHLDEDDLAAALAELDERFLAGEERRALAVLAAGQAWIEASRNQNVDVLRASDGPRSRLRWTTSRSGSARSTGRVCLRPRSSGSSSRPTTS